MLPNIPLITHINRSTKTHIPLISLSAAEQFRHNITNFIRSALMSNPNDEENKTVPAGPGLKKIAPYWYPYTTMTKMRWIGRELLEVVSTEFRDRSMEYYRYALESGVTTVNGQIASPTTILRDGDRVENVVHRHEPPVTNTPVRVLHHDKEREFIVVDKPGSIPVHASGRYFRNTLVEILVSDFGFSKPYPANRLDRLTSGLMIIPMSPQRARLLTEEFTAGTVKKEYVARVRGKFPEEQVVCEEPLLTVDRQMGLNIVHPEGKTAKTVFNLIRYDANTDTSVVKCEPHTGRSHQLRVHLQFLGHPIANDPVYSETRIWGENVGKGGINIIPSTERSAPSAPAHLQALTTQHGSPESLAKDATTTTLGAQNPENENENENENAEPAAAPSKPKLLPRETGEDIGMGSPVGLSAEAVGVITRLRNMKDEDEDWGRWRDVVFRAKGALNPRNLVVSPPPLQNRRVRGNKATFVGKTAVAAATAVPVAVTPPPPPTDATTTTGVSDSSDSNAVLEAQMNGVNESRSVSESTVSSSTSSASSNTATTAATTTPPSPTPEQQQQPQYTPQEIFTKISSMQPAPSSETDTTTLMNDNLYCSECYLPLHPDPKPEKLYIFLHARKYTTSLGAFETEMPVWAGEGWVWDQS